MATVNPIPKNYPRVTPYLSVKGADKAIEFYKKVFGAEERGRMAGPGGAIMHAEIQIGDSVIMMADEMPQFGNLSPQSLGGSPVSLYIFVKSVDEVFKAAVAAGAQVLMEVGDQFYGDRTGAIKDPFGHKWNIATRIEDVPPEEMQRRGAEMIKKMQAK